MPLTNEAKQLINKITDITTKDDIIECLKIVMTLDKQISASNDITDLKSTLSLIAELPKATTLIPEGIVFGAALSTLGAYLANFSFFGMACSGMAGGLLGCFTGISQEWLRFGSENFKKQPILYSLKVLNLDLENRIDFLHKQLNDNQSNGNLVHGLRHRHV